jgi:dTMP kinase
VPAQEAFERIEDVLQIHHEGGIKFYEKMREFYLGEISRWRGVRIDASADRSEDQVNNDLWNAVKAIL